MTGRGALTRTTTTCKPAVVCSVVLGNFEAAVKQVMDAVAGFGPPQQYFDDPEVEEIWINAPANTCDLWLSRQSLG